MRQETEQAKWLRQHLTINGETLSADVKAAAATAGFSEQVIIRAAAQIGVQIRRARSVPSYTTWSLPDGPQKLPDATQTAVRRLANLGHHDLAVALARTYTGTPIGDVGVVADQLIAFAGLLQDRTAG